MFLCLKIINGSLDVYVTIAPQQMWVGPMIAHSPPLSLYNHTPPTLRASHIRCLKWASF